MADAPADGRAGVRRCRSCGRRRGWSAGEPHRVDGRRAEHLLYPRIADEHAAIEPPALEVRLHLRHRGHVDGVAGEHPVAHRKAVAGHGESNEHLRDIPHPRPRNSCPATSRRSGQCARSSATAPTPAARTQPCPGVARAPAGPPGRAAVVIAMPLDTASPMLTAVLAGGKRKAAGNRSVGPWSRLVRRFVRCGKTKELCAFRPFTITDHPGHRVPSSHPRLPPEASWRRP